MSLPKCFTTRSSFFLARFALVFLAYKILPVCIFLKSAYVCIFRMVAYRYEFSCNRHSVLSTGKHGIIARPKGVQLHLALNIIVNVKYMLGGRGR